MLGACTRPRLFSQKGEGKITERDRRWEHHIRVPQALADITYERARQVMDVHAQALMEHDGVVALGIGNADDGTPRIIVYLDPYATAGVALPEHLEGVGVVTELSDGAISLNASTDE
jgi:hypothetical protein